MVKEPLIVGIDPGITTAYAVLDTKGNLLKLKSAKNLTLSALISELLGTEGKIVAVGSDVCYPPHYVQKFCSAFSAKLLRPKEDMKIGLKERMTAAFKTNDDHQRDALAAALFAFNELRPALQKVESHLKHDGKEHRMNEVKELVIQGWNIAGALEKLEKKEAVALPKKKIRQKAGKSNRIFEENTALKNKNAMLAKEIEFLRKRIGSFEKTISQSIHAKMHDVIEIKDRKIVSLYKNIYKQGKALEASKAKIMQLRDTLINVEGKQVIRRFKNMSRELINQLKENETIYINDPSSISETTLDYVKEQGATILSQNTLSSELKKSGLSLDANDLNIEWHDQFIIVNKDELKKVKEKRDILSKIVAEYREARS